jgi:hypothetical protein
MNVVHVGWCNDGPHDKVWGAIMLKGEHDGNSYVSRFSSDYTYMIFWGRRGKKLQSKLMESNPSTIKDHFNQKLDKGYKEIPKDKLNEVYPEFKTDLEKTAFWNLLKA